MGITCEDFEYSRLLDPLYWKQFEEYHDEQEQKQEEKEATGGGGGEEDSKKLQLM